MIEHVSVPVSDYTKSRDFYKKLLAPVGYELYRDMDEWKAGGYLEGESTSFWIVEKKEKITPIHVAVGAKSRKAVQQFHEAGLAAGGKDNGKAGLREEYGPDYYAAFILDPDGNNIEACYFGAE